MKHNFEHLSQFEQSQRSNKVHRIAQEEDDAANRASLKSKNEWYEKELSAEDAVVAKYRVQEEALRRQLAAERAASEKHQREAALLHQQLAASALLRAKAEAQTKEANEAWAKEFKDNEEAEKALAQKKKDLEEAFGVIRRQQAEIEKLQKSDPDFFLTLKDARITELEARTKQHEERERANQTRQAQFVEHIQYLQKKLGGTEFELQQVWVAKKKAEDRLKSLEDWKEKNAGVPTAPRPAAIPESVKAVDFKVLPEHIQDRKLVVMRVSREERKALNVRFYVAVLDKPYGAYKEGEVLTGDWCMKTGKTYEVNKFWRMTDTDGNTTEAVMGAIARLPSTEMAVDYLEGAVCKAWPNLTSLE